MLNRKNIVISACLISVFCLSNAPIKVNANMNNNNSITTEVSSSTASIKVSGYDAMLKVIDRETDKIKEVFGEGGVRYYSILASIGSMRKGAVRYTIGDSNKGPYLSVMGELYYNQKRREFNYFTKAMEEYITFDKKYLESEIEKLWGKTRPGEGNPTGYFETDDYKVTMTTSEFGGIPLMSFGLFPKKDIKFDGEKIFASFKEHYGDFFPNGSILTEYENKILLTTDIRYTENFGYGITTTLIIRDLENYKKYTESFIKEYNPDSSLNEKFLKLTEERMKEKNDKLEVVKLNPGNFTVLYKKDDYEDKNGKKNMVLILSISHPFEF